MNMPAIVALLVFCAAVPTRQLGVDAVPEAQAAAPSASQEEDISSPSLRIGWAEFKKLYDEGQVEVIDVRSEESFAAGHIPGARSIPLDRTEAHADRLKKGKRPVVLYCA